MRIAISSQYFDDYEAMSAAVASRIIALIRAKPDAVIGLATGSTPEGVYREICRRYSEAASTGDPIDFSKATFFALDEYVGVTADDSRSYHHYLWKKLLGPINANPDRVHIPKGDAIDKDEACAAYEAALKKAGKVDLWIVGLGHNGHVAFNEPKSAFDSRTRVVDLNKSTIDANKKYIALETPERATTVPTQAITVGLGTLKQYANQVLFLVNGQSKSDILHRALYGGVNSDLPASILQTMPTDGYFSDVTQKRLLGARRQRD